jgi:hypothetical protein
MNDNKNRFFVLLTGAMLLLTVFNACRQEEDAELPTLISYTTLVYMAADNNMGSQVDYTLEQLKSGAKRGAGTVVVYLDRQDETPRLFTITQRGEEKLLKTYREGNAASASTLAAIISDVKNLVPADQFGLVVWSHGMGWLPYGHSSAKSQLLRQSIAFPQTRYVCLDQYDGANTSPNVMEVDSLANALPDNVAQYIWFDACLMGSVETLYQLRNKCRYFVASPTEVLSEATYDASGIPYSKVLPYMFGGKDDLMKACGYYMQHYRSLRHPIFRSASVTLVDAAGLDSLYGSVSTIFKGNISLLASLDTTGIQGYHTDNEPKVFFDMGEVVKKIGKNSSAYTAFAQQLSRTVLYKDATDQIIDLLSIDTSRCSGLSMYIPLAKWKATNEYSYYFGKLGWAAVY